MLALLISLFLVLLLLEDLLYRVLLLQLIDLWLMKKLLTLVPVVELP